MDDSRGSSRAEADNEKEGRPKTVERSYGRTEVS
jgi:hypothetical protein